MNNAEDVLPQLQPIQEQPGVHTKRFPLLKPLKSAKLLVLLAAVLIIAGISIWMTCWTEYSLPQTAPPPDWKTYTSSTFPYTFKYPPTWELNVNFQTEDYDELYLSSPDLKNTKEVSGAGISLQVRYSDTYDLDALYDNVTTYFSDSIEEGKTYKSYKVYSKQYTYLDGMKALRLDIIRGDMTFGRGILAATVRNGKVYIFKFSQKDVDHLAVFDQILSTFKFTD